MNTFKQVASAFKPQVLDDLEESDKHLVLNILSLVEMMMDSAEITPENAKAFTSAIQLKMRLHRKNLQDAALRDAALRS